MPKVSVILSTFNGERFLSETVDSILSQTFRDFELIVIDDNAGADNGAARQIVSTYNDDRIVLIANERNVGYATSLNKGIAAAKGQYIAIQEHDDISLPTRLERQLEYLQSHPHVAFVSSSALVIDENGTVEGVREEYTEDIDLKWLVLWGQPVLHSIIMFRRPILENIGCYSEDPQYLYSPDQELVARALRHHPGANVREPLFKWRRHSKTLSNLNQVVQSSQGLAIVQDGIRSILGDDQLTPDVWLAVKTFMLNPPSEEVHLSAEQLASTVSFLRLLERSFYDVYRFSNDEVRRHRRRLYRSWAKHCFTLSYRNNGKRNFISRVTAFKLAVSLAGEAFISRSITANPRCQ